MSNGYGQIFLLLLAIGLILLAGSGKGRQVWDLLTGGNATTSTPPASKTSPPKKTLEDKLKEYDEAESGRGGVTA